MKYSKPRLRASDHAVRATCSVGVGDIGCNCTVGYSA